MILSILFTFLYPKIIFIMVMYVLKFYHTNYLTKQSSVWVHINQFFDMSWRSLWIYDCHYFDIIAKWSICFIWSHSSFQLVFYDIPGSFTPLNVKLLFMIFVFLFPLVIEALKPSRGIFVYSVHSPLNSSSEFIWF